MNETSDFQISKKYKTGVPRTNSHHIKGKVLRSCFFSIFKYNSIWIYVIFKLIHISFFLQNHQDMKIVLIYIVFSLHAWSSQGGADVFKVILFCRNTLTRESLLTDCDRESHYIIFFCRRCCCCWFYPFLLNWFTKTPSTPI